LARTLWDHLIADFPRLFWRSRIENSFNAFYLREAEGSVKRERWMIFWIGESDFARIGEVVEHLASLPANFEENNA